MPNRATLPANVAQWTVDPERAVFLVHDMQSFFLKPLPSPLRDELVHNVALLRKQCDNLDVPVAYTAQPGRMTDQQRGLLKDFWGPGMSAEPGERAVVPELAPAPSDWSLIKRRYSAFHNSDLLARMRSAGPRPAHPVWRVRTRRRADNGAGGVQPRHPAVPGADAPATSPKPTTATRSPMRHCAARWWF